MIATDIHNEVRRWAYDVISIAWLIYILYIVGRAMARPHDDTEDDV
jgi:hypothetical protein